ncbi:aminoglycoside phosphotransferase family protein [Nocardia takedensis]|uniref:aminoglycoside phosphotransferase family protein n=1 Tax=Nocardia takedensis TaxID=259390 RepID=UPI003F763E93
MATELSPSRTTELRAALTEACATVGLDAQDARLLRYTNNAVWALNAHPIVVRIAHGPLGRARAPRVAAMARWLNARDAPIVELLPDIEQPVITDTYAATFWQKLTGAENTWTATDLAEPLRQLHRLPLDDTTSDLPTWDPFTAARRRLAAADPTLPSDDHQWLSRQWSAVENDYRALTLDQGIVHGDAHTGNLLRDRTRTVLCDLDSTGIGPTAWDLAVTAVSDQRFATTFYTDLATAYGHDITTEPEWPTMRRIRELGLVTSVITDLARRPAVAAQHRHRLHDLRNGHTSRWILYE